MKLFARKEPTVTSSAKLAGGRHVPAQKVKLSRDPLTQALQARRFGRIVQDRQAFADHPEYKQSRDKAEQAIDELFALVPEGFVSIANSIFDQPGSPETDYDTEPFLLACHAVTNADYQLFVDCGGYEDLECWPEAVWPHLAEFTDQTGHGAPRFWRDGRHHDKLATHPVVGVSYYEAEAYAAWAGYRLPTEPEWQMAASWRVRSSAHVHRSYPWGDGLDVACCNIWASGHGGTLPVSACPGGIAPNGVQQLIGNTWEWVAGDFAATDREGRPVVGETLLKPIRGGAFDTYFPWQAVSAFRSGLGCVARMHNVGFRCALDLPGT